ncbi:MDR family NADP-dependent oxidoreductase [Actinospica robiniae]|uniref:MDR family NADP-dependent oxidoreductase n=1 Tax=Actinospica robiniae TaxID=304901 RepID=UPI00041054C6|nr:NADP-dependent oxidoreductase [Actinospica robiniae]
MPETATAVRQVRRPEGAPRPEDFELVEVEIPALEAGQVLVRNLFLSVDPYHRELMDSEGWRKGFGLEGGSLGRVVASREPLLPRGTIVHHRHGWSSHAVLTAGEVREIERAAGVPLSTYLGLLGGTGLTAYVGLQRIARLLPGEDVFISGAAGAVGSAAGQIARILGARRIVGSAGSPAKIKHLTDRLGFDAAFDYHDGIAGQLTRALPRGIDVYFDNVGGDHLEAAIGALRRFGRIAWCGAVAQYNNPEEPPPAPRNLYDVVGKSLRMEGFQVGNHLDAREELGALLIPRIQAGDVQVDETVTEGIEHTVDAFLGMLRGENIGKAVVQLADGVGD